MSKIVERIQKLLKLSTSDNANEAETAARMARKLMAEHAISEQDLAETRAGRHDPIVAVSFSLTGLKLNPDPTTFRYSRCKTPWWKRNLFFALVAYLDMRCSYKPASNVVTLYAYQSDVDVLAYLYDTCARQIDVAAKAWLASLGLGRKGGKTRGVQFRDSAVTGLRHKLEDLKDTDDVDCAASTTAIMLSKAKAIAAWVEETQTLRSKTVRRGCGHSSDGYKAGKNVRLNAGIGSRSAGARVLT